MKVRKELCNAWCLSHMIYYRSGCDRGTLLTTHDYHKQINSKTRDDLQRLQVLRRENRRVLMQS